MRRGRRDAQGPLAWVIGPREVIYFRDGTAPEEGVGNGLIVRAPGVGVPADTSRLGT